MINQRTRHQTDNPIEGKYQHGLILIITARWVLVLVGLVLTLYRAEDLFEMELSILVILGLAVGNFFLHVSTVTARPIQRYYIYAATVGDVAVISTIVAMTSDNGANSFVFYYPAVLAYTLVFASRISWLFTAGVVAAYSFVAFPTLILPDADIDIFVVRLLTLVAMASLATMYQQVERRRQADDKRLISATLTENQDQHV